MIGGHRVKVPPCMTLKQLKQTPTWGQLSIAEKRWLKEHFEDPQKALRVRLILQRAEQKARAMQALKRNIDPT